MKAPSGTDGEHALAGPTIHACAAILAIGDELAIGQALDTNSRWIAERLTARGIGIAEHVTVPDSLDAHTRALRRLAVETDLIVSTGGLGPTADDLTREALAAAMGEPLVEDDGALEQIKQLLQARGRSLTDLQRLQARRPRAARTLDNSHGTAPGLSATIRVEGRLCDVFCLPGPPDEMRPMFERFVEPALRPLESRVVRTRVLHSLGLAESEVARRLGPLMDRTKNPLIGTTASSGVVCVRIRFEGPQAGADAAMRGAEERCRQALAPTVFGADGDTIQSVVLAMLRERRERLVVAESCTGGGLGALFTGTPGSSEALLGGWITYSNEMKAAALGVPRELIAAHGAVSEPVARAMAVGALEHAPAPGAHHALAITGVAGPDGGTAQKPVGTVFIARASMDSASPERERGGTMGERASSIEVRRFSIPGGRESVRGRSALLALGMLRLALVGASGQRLTWEV